MKQLLFLLLFPCLAMAQYTGNGNQKITLGEQTTADGLVFRGLAADTTRKPSVDTMAYILLDTNTNIIWQYKKATNNAWTRVGGSISSGVTGTLPVANGGTNRTTMPAGYILHGDGTSVDTAIGLFWDRSLRFLGVGTTSPASDITINSSSTTPAMAFTQSFTNTSAQRGGFFWLNNSNSTVAAVVGQAVTDNVGTDLEFFTRPVGGSNTKNMILSNSGELLIGYTTDQGAYRLQINGTPQSTGALVVTSDENFKENITPLNKGLEIVNKLKPVTFNFISDTKNNFSVNEEVGFIAQDVDRALSTETFAKSIVNSADDSEPTSTMGLATQNLIPILVKAIQEQQALIKALEQRILILENK